MSTHFNTLRRYRFVLFSLSLILLLSIFYSLKSIGEDKDNPFDTPSPRSQNRAWYVIELGNIPIGTAVAGVGDQKTGLPYHYTLQFASRLGISPITSEIFAHVRTANDANTANNKQVVQKFLSKSDKGQLSEKTEEFLTTKRNFFFAENKSSSFEDVLQPFPEDFLNLEETFDASYSRDKFLQTASLKLKGNVPIEFKRVNEKKYQEEMKKIVQQRIDLSWLNSLEDDKDEMENLFRNLSYCQLEMQNLNKSIFKQMPHESYLMYRRIINLNQFCSKLEKTLSVNESVDNEKKFNFIGEHVKTMLKEDSSELPHAISQFPDRTMYYNNAVSFLWPRMTTVLIQNSVDEILNLFRLDFNRKSLLSIQLKITQMQQKAVVRADITQISSPVRFTVQTVQTAQPVQTNRNAGMKENSPHSYYLNGLTFANQPNVDLDVLCKNNGGNVGVELGEIPQSVVNSTGIRGVWDAQTRLMTARTFAIKATLEKNCRNIYFRTNPEFARFLQEELETLKNESLSLENSMLLSNYGQKKLWVMPGKYRIVISSIIDEKVISIQEFVVDENTQTNVVANIR